MKLILAVLCLLMTGCATRMWDPTTGNKTFETYSDITDIYVDGKKMTAGRINNSTPTRAGGSVLGTGLSGAAALGIGGIK